MHGTAIVGRGAWTGHTGGRLGRPLSCSLVQEAAGLWGVSGDGVCLYLPYLPFTRGWMMMMGWDATGGGVLGAAPRSEVLHPPGHQNQPLHPSIDRYPAAFLLPAAERGPQTASCMASQWSVLDGSPPRSWGNRPGHLLPAHAFRGRSCTVSVTWRVRIFT